MKPWAASIGLCAGCGFAALCCWGTPAVVSLLSATGLGFLIHHGIMIPLMVVFLGMNLWAIHHSSKRHERRETGPIALFGGLLVLSGFSSSRAQLGIGVVGLSIATGLDVYFTKACKKECQ